jgi:RNA polymerase sigma-70 factor, ECF subfamily
MTSDPDPTELLQRMKSGDRAAGDELLPLVYRELHRLASAQMAKQPSSHTLQPTALVNEAYLKLVGQRSARWENRGQFYCMASAVMRSVLVDHARAKRAAKRGGSGLRVALEEDLAVETGPDLDLLALDEALVELARDDAELARIVELRFFGGLTAQETADALGTSLRGVERGFRVARMRLLQRIGGTR